MSEKTDYEILKVKNQSMNQTLQSWIRMMFLTKRKRPENKMQLLIYSMLLLLPHENWLMKVSITQTETAVKRVLLGRIIPPCVYQCVMRCHESSDDIKREFLSSINQLCFNLPSSMVFENSKRLNVYIRFREKGCVFNWMIVTIKNGNVPISRISSKQTFFRFF